MAWNVKKKSVTFKYDPATNKFTYPEDCKRAFVLYEVDTKKIFAYVVPGYPVYGSERYAKSLVTQNNNWSDRKIAYAELQHFADHISAKEMEEFACWGDRNGKLWTCITVK